MYKPIIPALLFILFYTSAQAQIPVIGNANFFQLNKAYPYKYKVDTSLQTVTGGAVGAQVVWDFSALDFQTNFFAIDTTFAIDPAGTPKYTSCGISGTDTATICLVNKSASFARTDDYRYYCQKNGKITEVGGDQDNGVVEDVNFQFAQPPLYGLMPFSYHAVATGSFAGSYFSYLSGAHYVHGSDSVYADGYGTLKVDGQNFYNCVRMKKTVVKTDSNTLLGVYTTKYASYTWYSTGKEGPVFILEQNIDGSGPHTMAASYYFPKPTSSVGEEPGEMMATIYPIPSKGEVFIKLNSRPIRALSLSLYNSAGQLVMAQKIQNTVNKIDVSVLTAGVYWYELEGYKTGRLIKE